MSDIIESPVGEIQFMALKNKVTKKPGDTERTVYVMRCEFDGNTTEGKAFKEQISAINSALVGTKNVTKKGNFTVKAASKFEVRTVGEDGEVLAQDDMPVFTKGSTGKAVMLLKPYTGNSLGGSINLIGVGIHELNIAADEGGDQASRSEIIERLKASLGNS